MIIASLFISSFTYASANPAFNNGNFLYYYVEFVDDLTAHYFTSGEQGKFVHFKPVQTNVNESVYNAFCDYIEENNFGFLPNDLGYNYLYLTGTAGGGGGSSGTSRVNHYAVMYPVIYTIKTSTSYASYVTGQYMLYSTGTTSTPGTVSVRTSPIVITNYTDDYMYYYSSGSDTDNNYYNDFNTIMENSSAGTATRVLRSIVPLSVNTQVSGFPSISSLTGMTGFPSSIYATLTLATTKAAATKLNTEYPDRVPTDGATDAFYYTDYDTGMIGELLHINTGILETYLSHNELYFANLSQNLATFANNQKQIAEYVSGLIPSVDGIEAKLDDVAQNTYDAADTLGSIARRINNAFPQDEIGINTAVAQTVLDDTDGTGLTASKVAQSKFALDNNASIFNVDTTGGQYTTPADAITHGDWSFWSQTTVDNLGTGYTFSIDSLDAELMGDNDIYDENISALRRLIGW